MDDKILPLLRSTKSARTTRAATACSFLIAATFVMTSVGADCAQDDATFAGPFPSWTNVRTGYGAKGDGRADDTTALQAALDGLSASTPVLYIPAGTYRITRTLKLPARIYVSVIGENPTTTKIVWDGESAGARSAMLHLDGVAYSRIDRLTFDGRNKAEVAVDESWSMNGHYFDTGNQYADDTFENVGIGFRCGNLGAGCAETSMLRDRFVADSVTGIAMKNFNALDMFVWDSLFKDDAVGATNVPGAGNFHVYRSIFERSTSSDIVIGNTGLFNFRYDYSIGSNRFISTGATNNPANITIDHDTILDSANTTTIAVGNFGPVLLLDNTIRTLPGVTAGPVVTASGFSRTETDLFSMGNTFTVSSPTRASGHYHTIDDTVVDRSTVNPAIPALPPTPPNDMPTTFEVPPGSTAVQIQQIIDAATSSTAPRPVVHIPAGSYRIDATLEVPANREMEIIGDGYNSRLTWGGKTAGPVVHLGGPSKATLREISVSGNAHFADGIDVDNADQPDSRIFMESAFLNGSYTNLFIDELERTNVELHDFEHSDARNDSNSAVSVKVMSGRNGIVGRWNGGRVDIFAGASSGNNVSYGVSGDVHVGVWDVWYDAGGGGGQQIARVIGASTFTYAGSAMYQSKCTASPSISFHNFRGTAALLDLSMSCNVAVSGDGTNAKIAAIGLVSAESNFFTDESRPASKSEFLNDQTTVSPLPMSGSSEIAEKGPPDAAFLTAALTQSRNEHPTVLTPLPKGVTDVRFYRVFVDAAINGIHLEAARAATTGPRNSP